MTFFYLGLGAKPIWQQTAVDKVGGELEDGELHDRVGDLLHQDRHEALVPASDALGLEDPAQTRDHPRRRVRWRRDHLDANGLKGAERGGGEEFGSSTRCLLTF